jgi:hypothetical protein
MTGGLLVLYVGPSQPPIPVWHHATSCEEAFEYLDQTRVDQLWVEGDCITALGDTLAELLLAEEPWEGSKVGLLVIVVSDADAPPTELELKLAGHCPIRREVLSTAS